MPRERIRTRTVKVSVVEYEQWTHEQFKRWQKRMGFSVTQAAHELCLRERQIYLLRSGRSALTPSLTKLCRVLEERRGTG